MAQPDYQESWQQQLAISKMALILMKNIYKEIFTAAGAGDIFSHQLKKAGSASYSQTDFIGSLVFDDISDSELRPSYTGGVAVLWAWLFFLTSSDWLNYIG